MVIFVLALLVLVLFGAGFAIHLLWIAAVILTIVWVQVLPSAVGRAPAGGLSVGSLTASPTINWFSAFRAPVKHLSPACRCIHRCSM